MPHLVKLLPSRLIVILAKVWPVALPGCEHRLPILPIVSLKGNAMADSLDPHDLVTLAELAISTRWETSALVEVLERGRGCC